jgi:2-C-methyl-D-erythritol 4-phosphate cytidylyltransferase
MSNIAIIPSAGTGSRFNSPIPKQYVKVLGKELIVYTLEIFQNSNCVDEIIIPADKSFFNLLFELKEKYNLTKITQIVEGGIERQDSVFNGITSKNFDENDLIIVHDAVRALLSNSLLNKAINQANKSDSIVVAIKARDTLIKGIDFVKNYVDRNEIYYAQTPQIFRYKILFDAFKKANNQNFKATDESMIVKNAGYNVKIVEGEFINFKVTEKSDILFLENRLKSEN